MARTTLYDSVTDTWGSKKDIENARKKLSPSSYDIRSARHKSGLTMQEAADLVYVSQKTWSCWEKDVGDPHHQLMHPSYAELFALKSGIADIYDMCPHLKRLKDGKD